MPSEKCRVFRQAFFGSFSAVSPYFNEDHMCHSGRSSHQHPMHHPCAQCDSDVALADRRSAHNALERQRREQLNVKLQELAHTLPSLQNVHRPSKTMIVEKSLEFVSNSITRESKFKNEIQQLRQLNESLRNQAMSNMTQYLMLDHPSLFMTAAAFYDDWSSPPMTLSTTTTSSSDNLSTLSSLQ